MNNKLPEDLSKFKYLIAQRTANHKLNPIEESDNAGVEHANLKWCSMSCEHADWPKDNIDGAKSCRTFNAIWCKKLEAHVTRNTPCSVEHGARRPKPIW